MTVLALRAVSAQGRWKGLTNFELSWCHGGADQLVRLLGALAGRPLEKLVVRVRPIVDELSFATVWSALSRVITVSALYCCVILAVHQMCSAVVSSPELLCAALYSAHPRSPQLSSVPNAHGMPHCCQFWPIISSAFCQFKVMNACLNWNPP